MKEKSIKDIIEEKYTRYLNCETYIIELTLEEAKFILETGERRNYVTSILQEAGKVLLSNYKRVLKENEELTISNKEIDKECSRLEKKEIELINENEHYKDLIYALKTYYDITEEDLEKCMKNDR